MCPLCVAASLVVVRLLASIQPESYTALAPQAWAMLIGFALWIALYFTLPRPIRTYVLAHELTHALWAFLTGARVSRLRVSRRGGSVRVSRNNFLITLAPYFFPFYTVLIIFTYGLIALFVDPGPYELYWLGLIGLTWGFHATFTVSTLMTHQDDIRMYGHVFSYAVIYLFNIGGISLWIVAVSSARLEHFSEYMLVAAGEIYGGASDWVWAFFPGRVQ